MKLFGLLVLFLACLPLSDARAQTSKPGIVILDALRNGGLVVFIRHAHPDVGEDKIGELDYFKDCAKQRLLRNTGRIDANTVSVAFRGLGVPVSRVISGDLCLAKQTADLLNLGTVEVSSGVNDYNTWKAQGNDPGTLVDAYRKHLSLVPTANTNIILISHAQRGRFSAHPVLDLIEMGTVAIFKPGANVTFELLATIRPQDWKLLGVVELPSN